MKHADGLYASQFPLLRKNAESIDTSAAVLDRVNDVAWRLDWIVKSTHVERATHPIFTVGLKTDMGGSIEFEASREELMDFVTKAKDALRAAEKLAKQG